MRRFRVMGLGLASLSLMVTLLVVSAQAGAAKPQPNKVKQTATPIWTLAMDGPRVAYSSGGRVYIWNVVTGATSTIKGTYSNAAHTVNAAELAIAGQRVAWIKRQEFGNTELHKKLFTAKVGGSARQLKSAFGNREIGCGSAGPQIEGLVGSGTFLAVSTWLENADGTVSTNRKLNLITPTRLRTIATGSNAIVSAATDGRNVAAVPLPTASMDPDYCVLTPSTTVAIRSAAGKLLGQVATGPSAGIALSGKRLVMLAPPPAPTIKVYDWANGTLLHTWPVIGAATSAGGPNQEGHVQVYGRLALYSVYTRYVGGFEKLRLLDLNTGKDVVVTIVKGFGYNRAWALGPRGLVYVANRGRLPLGKLVFVPMTKLLAMVSQRP